MNSFDDELKARLEEVRQAGRLRSLRRVDSPQGTRIKLDGRELLNFSSNDYLGLANHPALKEAAAKAVKDFGAGAGAARLVCGSLAPFHDLEEALAAFKGAEAALTFSTGYATAVGTISALLSKDDIVILDKLVHASIVDAARLSGAKLRVFAHNDVSDLEDKLRWAEKAKAESGKQKAEILVVTESIFSMDGDAAPLREIVDLKDKHGAWLMVDEAHATGLYGKYRRGLAEELGVSDRIEIQMGTLGKALGASGGYICGSRMLIDYLINNARSFIFSTAPVPASAAAALAGIRLVQSAEGKQLNEQLWARVKELHCGLRIADCGLASAIVPIILGEEAAALEAAAKLREQGLFVPAIRYPTVAKGTARLRVTLTAGHTAADVQGLTKALSEIVNRPS